VLLDKNKKPVFNVGSYAFINATSPSYQIGLPLPPLGIESLHTTGFSAAFFTRAMPLLIVFPQALEKRSIDHILICADPFVLIIFGNICPESREGFLRTISQSKAQNLPDLTGNGNPEPQRRGMFDTDLIDLNDILRRSRQSGKFLLLYGIGSFFRT
jgi:hypothetical protein